MHLEQLQAILEVAAARSITAAAKNLSTNQPSLSRTIKSFEKELGVPFFTRIPDGVKLTEQGERLLPFVAQIVNDVYALDKEAFRASADTCREAPEETVIRLLTTPVILDSLLGPALAELATAFPQLDIAVSLIDSQDPCESLDLAAHDLFIGGNIAHALDGALQDAVSEQQLWQEALFTENFRLIMGHSHPLAGSKAVTLQEILCYPVILHDNGFASNDFYQHYLESPQKMTVLFKSNNPRTITETLLKGQALLITTDAFSQNDYAHNKALTILPVKNLQIAYFCLHYNTQSTSCAIREIISTLKYTHARLVHA